MFVILLLLYADDVVFFTNTVEWMQQFIEILELFCQDSGLTVNVSKTKMMVVRTKQPKTPPKVFYAGQPIEVVSTFKYLGIELPTDHKWHTCGASLSCRKMQVQLFQKWVQQYRYSMLEGALYGFQCICHTDDIKQGGSMGREYLHGITLKSCRKLLFADSWVLKAPHHMYLCS